MARKKRPVRYLEFRYCSPRPPCPAALHLDRPALRQDAPLRNCLQDIAFRWVHGVWYIDLSATLRSMNTKAVRRLIVAAIVVQFLWSMILPAGNTLAPRSPEMAQALRAFEANRSAATEAAMWEQVRRDDLRDRQRDKVIFGLMLLVDVLAVCLFWNYGITKAATNSRQQL